MNAPRMIAGTLVMLVTALAAGPLRAGTWEAIERLPEQQPSELHVNDKPRLYFRVSPGHPLSIPLEGPLRLRITSRIEMPKGHAGVVQYTMRLMEGTREIEREETESSASDQVVDPSGPWTIGKSRKMTVELPPGMHRLSLEASGATVRVRLQQAAPPKGGEATVTLTPVDAPRYVTVIEGEKAIPYATTTVGKPVRLRVVGPTTLDLMTRLDFDPAMRGDVTYTLLISEKGKRVREVGFKTSKAMDASFKELRDRVPSKFDRLQISIQDGLHELEVVLVSPKQGAAEIHARIPQPSVGGGEE